MISICVLMSTYNGADYVETQLDSIYGQDRMCEYGHLKIDVLVRDDGSSDSTIKILEKYENTHGLKWYTGDNLGAALSFLDLIKKSDKYDYYAFSDQDDYWASNKMAMAISMLEGLKREFFEQNSYHVPMLYGSNAELADSHLEPLGIGVYSARPMLDYKTVSCTHGLLGCTMVFDYELAKYIRNFAFPQKMVMHDFYLTLLCGLFDGKIIFDDKSHMLYRQHDNNVCGISYGMLNKIKALMKTLRSPGQVGIAEQAGELCDIYHSDIDETKMKWLKKVSEYKDSFGHKLRLAFSREYKLYSLKRTLSMRCKIFFGKM